jgi:hypothetical protein
MNPLNFINFRQVSQFLAGGTENIRTNKIPAKYAEAVKELTEFVKEWEKKHSKTDNVSTKPQTEP